MTGVHRAGVAASSSTNPTSTVSLIFYTNPNSRGRIVRWMLEEVGATYETVILDYRKSSETDRWGGAALERPRDDRARFFSDVNPIGKIPAIEHDGRVVSEAGAVCAYLAETFPAAGLAPTPEERADYYRWLFFVAGPLEQAVTNHRAGFAPLPEQEFFFGYGSLERTLDQLERAVRTHPFIAGDRFTAADVYVASHIGWGLALGTVPQREAFLAYARRMTARAAFERAVAKDRALLEAQAR